MRPRDVAGHPYNDRQGCDRALRRGDRQGRSNCHATRSYLGERRPLPRRRRNGRERVRSTPRAGCRHQDRPGRDTRRAPPRRARRCRSRARIRARDAAGTGSTESTRCPSSATRCSPTARPSHSSHPTHESPGCATHARTLPRSLRTSLARTEPGISPSPPCESGLSTWPAISTGTMTVETRWPGVTVTDWLEEADERRRRRRSQGRKERAPCSTMVRVLTGRAWCASSSPRDPSSVRCR